MIIFQVFSLFLMVLLSISSWNVQAFRMLKPSPIVPHSSAKLQPTKISPVPLYPHSSLQLHAESKFRPDEEYFESDFDRKPLKDRLPVAYAVFAGISLPFIIGLVFLYMNK